MEIQKVRSLKGEIRIPGDKSISHRAIMFGSIGKGTTEITNFLQGADCLSTIDCFRKMGITIKNEKDNILIEGKGLHGLTPPSDLLDVGNSGTTIRLLSGILCGQEFETTLTGDSSIQKRPMTRIIEPLSKMGGTITSVYGNGNAPLKISGGPLHGISYDSPVASAQVKSAILLAGLYAEGETTVKEPYLSRNHTELMLSYFGGDVKTRGTRTTVLPNPLLEGQKISVPGDISSAAYFIAAGLIVPNSEILIKNVGINPTRDGIIEICQKMGGDISLLNVNTSQGEHSADILVRSSELTGTVIEGDMIPRLIDELPVLAVLGCFAKGRTIIKDAAELKVKESNRIDVMVRNLSSMNAHIQGTDDGMIIEGGYPLAGNVIDSNSDHRIAMSLTIAGLRADGLTKITNSQCVDISYPDFYRDLRKLKVHPIS